VVGAVVRCGLVQTGWACRGPRAGAGGHQPGGAAARLGGLGSSPQLDDGTCWPRARFLDGRTRT
jgi:hypothetical protein